MHLHRLSFKTGMTYAKFKKGLAGMDCEEQNYLRWGFAANLPDRCATTARQQINRCKAVFLCPKFVPSLCYTMLNDSANNLMLLFCKRINTV